MTRGEIWKDFFKRNVLPAVIALFLFFMFKNIFTLDGIIGGGILIWRLVVATWYIPLTIYRLLTADKSATPQINIEKGFKSYE